MTRSQTVSKALLEYMQLPPRRAGRQPPRDAPETKFRVEKRELRRAMREAACVCGRGGCALMDVNIPK